jgi:mannitol/fructose-specific phosphotransferase system IIA component (Ntr-type)
VTVGCGILSTATLERQRRLQGDRSLQIIDFLNAEVIIPRIKATSKAGALEELVDRLAQTCGVEDVQGLLEVIQAREDICSTAIGEGVAIPHGKFPGVKRVFAAFARSQEGIDFDAPDGQPTHFFFLLVAPEGSTSEHLNALARVSKLIKDPLLRERLMEVTTPEEIMAVIKEKDTSL